MPCNAIQGRPDGRRARDAGTGRVTRGPRGWVAEAPAKSRVIARSGQHVGEEGPRRRAVGFEGSGNQSLGVTCESTAARDAARAGPATLVLAQPLAFFHGTFDSERPLALHGGGEGPTTLGAVMARERAQALPSTMNPGVQSESSVEYMRCPGSAAPLECATVIAKHHRGLRGGPQRPIMITEGVRCRPAVHSLIPGQHRVGMQMLAMHFGVGAATTRRSAGRRGGEARKARGWS